METTPMNATEMVNGMNASAMTYTNLLKKKNDLMSELMALDSLIETRRKEDIKNITQAYVLAMMGGYKTSMEELKECLGLSMKDFFGEGWTINVDEQTADTTKEEEIHSEDSTILAIPETTETEEVLPTFDELLSDTPQTSEPEGEPEDKIDSTPRSVFEDPALLEPYNPAGSQEEVKETTPETEEVLPTFDELLSTGPVKKPVVKTKRTLPTLDELLSGEPIPRILNMGNLRTDGIYEQNTRICHTDGIIPTETASGSTLIYIPS